VRATLGRLLFSGEETRKSVKVLSGGEKGRMIYGKLMLTKPNVLLLDEPTNHMDMETIESLQIGVEKYPGTMVFVSHDREFVGGIANRIIEVRPGGSIVDFKGTYDEYLSGAGNLAPFGRRGWAQYSPHARLPPCIVITARNLSLYLLLVYGDAHTVHQRLFTRRATNST